MMSSWDGAERVTGERSWKLKQKSWKDQDLGSLQIDCLLQGSHETLYSPWAQWHWWACHTCHTGHPGPPHSHRRDTHPPQSGQPESGHSSHTAVAPQYLAAQNLGSTTAGKYPGWFWQGEQGVWEGQVSGSWKWCILPFCNSNQDPSSFSPNIKEIRQKACQHKGHLVIFREFDGINPDLSNVFPNSPHILFP